MLFQFDPASVIHLLDGMCGAWVLLTLSVLIIALAFGFWDTLCIYINMVEERRERKQPRTPPREQFS